jgi:hypothetical protein
MSTKFGCTPVLHYDGSVHSVNSTGHLQSNNQILEITCASILNEKKSTLSIRVVGIYQSCSRCHRKIKCSVQSSTSSKHIRKSSMGYTSFTVVKHDEGINSRSCAYTCICWITFLGFPLDFQKDLFVRAAVAPFGYLLEWYQDENGSRLLVHALVLSPDRIPLSLIVSRGTLIVVWEDLGPSPCLF